MWIATESHLLREMWIEIRAVDLIKEADRRVISCGRCGLKYLVRETVGDDVPSHLLREMWIEIAWGGRSRIQLHESSPAGDVD